MDPIAISARGRWTEPKRAPPPAKDLTPFQQKLYRNSYAHVLASPVRACRYTNTVLPKPFYLDLHPKPHPDTREPWLLPTTLHAAATPCYFGSPAHTPTTRVLARRPLLRHLCERGVGAKRKKTGRWREALSFRMVEKLGEAGMRKMVWREDLDDVVLDLMRRVAFRRLQWGFVRPGGGGVLKRVEGGLKGLDDVEDVGAVLFLRKMCSDEVTQLQEGVRTALDRGDHLATEITKIQDWANKAVRRTGDMISLDRLREPRLQPSILFPRLEMPTVEWRGKHVQVYGLWEMLGEQKMKDLLENTAWKEEQVVVLKESNTTIQAHLALMQLQIYIAENL